MTETVDPTEVADQKLRSHFAKLLTVAVMEGCADAQAKGHAPDGIMKSVAMAAGMAVALAIMPIARHTTTRADRERIAAFLAQHMREGVDVVVGPQKEKR